MVLAYSAQGLGDRYPLAEVFQIGRRFHMTRVELWPHNAGEGGYTKENVAAVKALARSMGVSVVCVTQWGPGRLDGPESAAEYTERLCATVRAAAELGALRVNHYCMDCTGADEAEQFSEMERVWTKPLLLAEQLGVTLCIENEAGDMIAAPEQTGKVVRHFDSPFFKTNFDETNYYQAGFDGFPDAYDALRDCIGYVHLKNARKRNGKFEYVPIPEGAVNIPGLIRKIEEDGYSGPFTLEPHTAPEQIPAFFALETEWLAKLGFFNPKSNLEK